MQIFSHECLVVKTALASIHNIEYFITRNADKIANPSLNCSLSGIHSVVSVLLMYSLSVLYVQASVMCPLVDICGPQYAVSPLLTQSTAPALVPIYSLSARTLCSAAYDDMGTKTLRKLMLRVSSEMVAFDS